MTISIEVFALVVGIMAAIGPALVYVGGFIVRQKRVESDVVDLGTALEKSIDGVTRTMEARDKEYHEKFSRVHQRIDQLSRGAG